MGDSGYQQGMGEGSSSTSSSSSSSSASYSGYPGPQQGQYEGYPGSYGQGPPQSPRGGLVNYSGGGGGGGHHPTQGVGGGTQRMLIPQEQGQRPQQQQPTSSVAPPSHPLPPPQQYPPSQHIQNEQYRSPQGSQHMAPRGVHPHHHHHPPPPPPPPPHHMPQRYDPHHHPPPPHGGPSPPRGAMGMVLRPVRGMNASPRPQRHVLLNSPSQRLVKVPQGNIRLVVQRRTENHPLQEQETIYLKPGGQALNEGPRHVRLQQQAGIHQQRPGLRMMMHHSPGGGGRVFRAGADNSRMQNPRQPQLPQSHPQPAQQQQQMWANSQQINSTRQSFQPPQQPQQQQQPPSPLPTQQHPPQNEIAYNVEHVFMENGREVKKMPIKFGDKTIWVDCVGNSSENQDDQVIFDLMENDPTLASTGSNIQSNQQPHAVATSTQSVKYTGSQGERDQIVKAVLYDLISPAELSARHGVGVAKIRDWVKATGHKLPSRYKKTKSNSSASSPPPPQPPTKPLNTYNSGGTDMNETTPISTIVCPPHSNGSLQPHPPPPVTQQRPNPTLVVPSSHQAPQEYKELHIPESVVPVSQVQPSTPPVVSVTHSTTPPLKSNTEPYKPKLIHGKLALCKNCGSMSPDFNRCIRCKKVLPETCKVIDDPNASNDASKTEKSLSDKEESLATIASQNLNTTVTTTAGESSIPTNLKPDLRGVRIHPKQRRKPALEEPECIALSSDEENEENSSKPLVSGEDAQLISENKESDEKGDGGAEEEKDDPVVECPIKGQYCSLHCRSVRIGSYKSIPRDKVIFTERGLRVVVPSIEDSSEAVTIDIRKTDILQFLVHFGKGMPILFLYVSLPACKRARDTLKMDKTRNGFWLDVTSSDETQKRITILPEKMTDETKHILVKNYGQGLMQELDSKEANDILVRSSPKDNSLFKMSAPPNKDSPRRVCPPSMKYCTFPPSGSSSVTVTTEDYCVLEDESFLNDVIIDFYFRYLQFKIFNESDRERTHIFSTYFYNRLTSRPKKQKNKLHPVEDNPNLSPAEKRYERVKRWTKKVNLFDKDFVVIPINEHSHWFVAIICFPGQVGCRRADNNEPVESPPSQIPLRNPVKKRLSKPAAKRIVQIGSTTIIPLKTGETEKISIEEEFSDRDEADASDDEMMDEESSRTSPLMSNQGINDDKKDPTAPKDPLSVGKYDEAKDSSERNNADDGRDGPDKENSVSSEVPNIVLNADKKSFSERYPIKQPCILIFDSLATGSRARVAATLRDYLMCEFKAKIGESREFTKDNMMGHCPKVPQQPNFSDCGIFLLQYVESFFESPIHDYHLPLTNLRNWFPADVVRNKRSEIAKIIRDLAAEQNPGKEIEFPKLLFTPASGSGYTDDELDEEMDEEYGEEEDEEEEEEDEIDEEMESSGEFSQNPLDSNKSGFAENVERSGAFSSPQYMVSKKEATSPSGGKPAKTLPSIPGVQINRVPSAMSERRLVSAIPKKPESASASPDSTSTKEDESKNLSSLVDYSDSGSDETPVPDSSQGEAGSATKRPPSAPPEGDESKKTKVCD